MKKIWLGLFVASGLFQLCIVVPAAAAPSVSDIIARLIDTDPFGLGGAIVLAHATLTDKRGTTRDLSFSARSLRYDPPYSKSVVRFTAPPDLAGAGFLQVQNRTADDDRYLFLPELKRSRRISGNLRSNSFMGTDFSFADLDRRDLRDSASKRGPDENIGPFPCYRIDSTPTRGDSPYSHVEIWIRIDNSLPLKMNMYDKSNVLFKTFTAQEVRRVSGHWYITRSRMVDHVHTHETELVLDSVSPSNDVGEDEFTVRNLEKL